ncbi:uncharacterized protein GGS25DRAFT_518778 [Hypoxylon fragiforme]|uniref:uncharacterized protein n=1 Tax=Hypoxylon fragiforme TaxID=63214 RepID=UPI0020C67AE7|nr:uncharacterized protein GGS25DRAFT_518778 [Hypoxylon fragiforme]KAI2613097.1 hypothetical protein GGS25DRAFT_518778 [Hypoxylon fragiforme]
MSLFQTLNTTGNVPIVIHQGGQQPIYVQTPGQPQPGITVVGQQPQAAAQPSVFPPQMVANATMPGAFPSGVAPDVMGIGKTGTEVQMEQYYTALNNGALEGQDIAPADPDPSRMYYVRELDGEWTLRNRFGIDNLDGCRWYVMPGGVFYAVRTPE